MSQARNIARGTGTSANNLVQLNGSAQLPAVSGANLTNLPTPASGQIQTQVFTSSGTWTAPTGVTKVMALVVGGGGGARNSSSFVGGRGGIAVGNYTVVPGTTYTITVGTGGTGNSTAPTAGATSSFGAFCSATGGAGAASGGNGADGNGSGGTIRNNNILYASGFIHSGTTTKSTDTNVNPRAYAIDGIWSAGASGDFDGCGANAFNGGVGGVVHLEWVG